MHLLLLLRYALNFDRICYTNCFKMCLVNRCALGTHLPSRLNVAIGLEGDTRHLS
jgi:hypothetical protein